ncbi:ribonuclease H-like domain-containing protein [Tanacetum coccineum]
MNSLHFKQNVKYIGAKDEKLKRYRRIGMKAVKEKEQLQKTVDSWKNSSKNLWKLVDSVDFQKTDYFLRVSHPLTGDYTPKPQEEIDDSLYVYGKKGPQKPEISDSDDNSTEHSTCQSNDSEGSFGNPSEHSSESESESISVPNEMSASKSVITNEKVVSESKEVEPSCATHVKTPRQQMKNQGTSEVKGKNWNKMMERELGEGYSFIRKVFVWVAKPVWTNANKVNHANQFVPRSVQLNAGRPNINSVRPNINTGRTNVNSVRPNINSVRQNVNSVRTNINTVRSKQPVPTNNTNSFSPVRPQVNKEIRALLLRPQQVIIGGDQDQTLIIIVDPILLELIINSINMEDRGIFDSGCSGHMTGNKDHLDDFEEYKEGSVTFGGSKGYITGKGRIRVGNLDFDSVSFVKELGHFNLFSISKLWIKRHKNGVAERMNRTLIEVARTMLADSLLPTTFWAEAVSTACYIFNRCDEGFLVGYSLNSKAFRVYNLVTKKVEVNLHVKFLEEKPNVKGVGYRWMFDIDYLTDSMNYIPVSLDNQSNPHAGTSEVTNSAGTLQTPNANASEEADEDEELIVVPTAIKHSAAKVGPRKSSTNSKEEKFLTELQNLQTQEKEAFSTGISEDTPEILAFRRDLDQLAQKHLREVTTDKATSTNSVNSGSEPANTQPADQDDSDMPELTIFNKPQKGIFDEASYDEEGMVHDFNNLPTEVAVSPIPTLRIHNIHPQSQILGDPKSSVQTRSRVKQTSGAHVIVVLYTIKYIIIFQKSN